MKFILGIWLCLVLGWNVGAQTRDAPKTATAIKEIALAKADGKGGIGEIAEKFATTDTPIYFIIQLDSLEPMTVKMNLIAVKAQGLPPETKSVNVSYTTDGRQDRVNFNAAPSDVWAAGSYRADFFVNGEFAESRRFEIEVSPAEATAKKPLPAKNFAPRKKPRRH